jgi:phosphopantothenoylcysteine decarboxylase / phosphopantothenate---cysteine ligase
VVRVTTAGEMERAMRAACARAQVVLMAAAVADYRPAQARAGKIKRGAGAMTIALEPNPDILAGLAARRRRGQTFVGFALETSRGVANARAKLRAKKLDLVVLNAPASSIGRDTNRVTFVGATTAERLPEMAKREVAERLLDRVLAMRENGGPSPRRRVRPSRRKS